MNESKHTPTYVEIREIAEAWRHECQLLQQRNAVLVEALRSIADKSWSPLCSDTAAEEMQEQARAALKRAGEE
jgi:hypothetical protein